VEGTVPPLLAVGYLARAHGLKGRVLVVPFNDGSEGLERATALWLSRAGAPARRYAVTHAERVDLGYLFGLQGIADRNASEALRGMEVRVARDELPEMEEGEFLEADLIGLRVFDADAAEPAAPLGVVTALEAAGPNELLVVQLASGESALAPIALVREVDLENRQLFLEVPEGLFDLQSATSAAPAGEEEPAADEDESGAP